MATALFRERSSANCQESSLIERIDLGTPARPQPAGRASDLIFFNCLIGDRPAADVDRRPSTRRDNLSDYFRRRARPTSPTAPSNNSTAELGSGTQREIQM